jgi:hypothetical protein
LDDIQFPVTGDTLFHIFTRIQTQIEEADAEFGGWNGAMFESGMHRAGTLAPAARCAAGKLQQLWRAAAQRAASAATAISNARAANEEFPADGARPLKFLRDWGAQLSRRG